MPFFDNFASSRWSPLRMRTKVVSFFILSKSFQTKKIKDLRPKMTKIASRGSCLKAVGMEKGEDISRPIPGPWLQVILYSLLAFSMMSRSSGCSRKFGLTIGLWRGFAEWRVTFPLDFGWSRMGKIIKPATRTQKTHQLEDWMPIQTWFISCQIGDRIEVLHTNSSRSSVVQRRAITSKLESC